MQLTINSVVEGKILGKAVELLAWVEPSIKRGAKEEVFLSITDNPSNDQPHSFRVSLKVGTSASPKYLEKRPSFRYETSCILELDLHHDAGIFRAKAWVLTPFGFWEKINSELEQVK